MGIFDRIFRKKQASPATVATAQSRQTPGEASKSEHATIAKDFIIACRAMKLAAENGAPASTRMHLGAEATRVFQLAAKSNVVQELLDDVRRAGDEFATYMAERAANELAAQAPKEESVALEARPKITHLMVLIDRQPPMPEELFMQAMLRAGHITVKGRSYGAFVDSSTKKSFRVLPNHSNTNVGALSEALLCFPADFGIRPDTKLIRLNHISGQGGNATLISYWNYPPD